MNSTPATRASRRPPEPEALLDALDPDQRQVAEHLEGALSVLAGPGSGKTRAITYRIAYGAQVGAYQPSQVLALSFTKRAAGEMRSRLASLGVPGVQARTFHSAALRQLRHFWPTAVGGYLPELVPGKLPLVATAAQRLGISVDKTALRDLAAEVEWAKVTLTLPEDYEQVAQAAGRVGVADQPPARVAQLLSAYEEAKSERGVLDFEDTLLVLIGILLDRQDIAEAVRGQYKHFVVDEYQDVSPLQQRLLDVWLGRRRQLCVVGDVSQTIYSFTGATPRFLREFPHRYAGARVLTLSRDYRSTPQVVAMANQVLSTPVRPGAPRGLPHGAVHLVSQRPSGPAPLFLAHDDDVAEAQAVAEQVRRLRAAGVPLSEIAVLYRTHAQSPVLEQELAQAGISHVVRGGAPFFRREEVKQAMAFLRAAPRTEADTLTGDLLTDVKKVLSHCGWSETAPATEGAARERWASLEALVSLAEEQATHPEASLEGFVAELLDRAQNEYEPRVDSVTLSPLHTAKGLEWDAVIIVGLSDGLLPLRQARSTEELEEERRLLYVGVTRPRDHLVLSYARARNPGGRPSRQVSRFLRGTWPQEVPAPSPAQLRKARAQSFEEESDAATLALFSALKQWRKEVATSASLPAYTVFPDVTLREIALTRPASRQELAQVKGVGGVKLERYGQEVLEIVSSQQTAQ
ncbi:ATP-dependent helicase [Actinomyces weissii]|uniref:DNA 3'-5' helicase n=1 Tax=Actinomyces weissii TaxID=675090 RepID=A0A7T7M8J4_9ACTO|nr:ATP-dependent DNA helicase UvrD2 [Actinomyces weissii]QQM66881.1 ATP-dependent DNA helicase UvrD2 [Actinomyces weissii]